MIEAKSIAGRWGLHTMAQDKMNLQRITVRFFDHRVGGCF